MEFIIENHGLENLTDTELKGINGGAFWILGLFFLLGVAIGLNSDLDKLNTNS